MDETLRTWGRNIKTFRTARRLAQKELGAMVGVTDATVCRWERGQLEPRRQMKVRIATALDTDVSVLFPLVRGAA